MEHLHPKRVHEILQASPDTLLIDCRTDGSIPYTRQVGRAAVVRTRALSVRTARDP